MLAEAPIGRSGAFRPSLSNERAQEAFEPLFAVVGEGEVERCDSNIWGIIASQPNVLNYCGDKDCHGQPRCTTKGGESVHLSISYINLVKVIQS